MTVRSMMAARHEGPLATSRAPAISDSGESLMPTTLAGHALVALAHELYVGRRKRERHLSSDLFGEPTWDILLDLYVAAREDRRVPTTSACIGAHVPPTTALRWLRILEAKGLVEREDDGRDGRRTFVRLTDKGLLAMDGWLEAMLLALDKAMTRVKASHA